MTTNANNEQNELDDDEATMAASGDALDEIRAEARRVRAEQADGFDAGDDPTTVMSADPDLAEEPTIITGFDSVDPTTAVETFDADEDLTTGAFDPSEDPTTVMSKNAATVAEAEATQAEVAQPEAPPVWQPESTRVAVDPSGSLIEGKAPPAAEATYWQSGELAAEEAAVASTGKGPVPKWFIATSLLAVLMAVGLVLLVLWALSS